MNNFKPGELVYTIDDLIVSATDWGYRVGVPLFLWKDDHPDYNPIFVHNKESALYIRTIDEWDVNIDETKPEYNVWCAILIYGKLYTTYTKYLSRT